MTELNDYSRRAHALLSASSAARWLACPPSAFAAAAYPNEETPYTREGTVAHEVAEAVASGKETPTGSEITDEMVKCAEGYRDYIAELTASSDAVVLLEQRVDFSPWVPQGFGTCDCILIQGDTLTIIDYKYGKGVAVSAEGNPQMRLYALGALNDYGIAYDVDRIETHIYQPRLNSITAETLTAQDLLTWADTTVKPTAALAAKGKGTYEAGPHCKFCPHAGRCRRLAQVCLQKVESHGMKLSVPVLAPFEVAEILGLEGQITAWLKRIKAQALTMLLDGGEIPGWKVVEGKQGNRKWIDELRVLSRLTEAGYKSEDVTETRLLSPAAMDKALGRRKAAELLSELIEREPGAPTVAEAADKRPPYNRLAEAKEDFA